MEELPSKVQAILQDEESVQWHGSSNKLAKLIEGLFGTLLFFGFIAVFITIFASGAGYPMAGLAIGGGLILIWGLLAVGEYMVGQTVYVGTENRLIRYKEGVLDSDTEYIEWENSNQIDTSEGMIDSLFNTGTVVVEGHKTDDVSVKHIENPYDATNTLEELRG